ncbi:hypothetical protein NYO98_10410 [Nocardioides sp. STR2]|uniref:Uncharacterized protein n=1 Tax=Nocardioides pini TaxID=2975053 RepID=A0ABT4CCK6_9ACTN|nr:hypothetical protein [Nocardioides pini]MCY4726690.1 hypothetical protein [Nocardioides pini]
MTRAGCPPDRVVAFSRWLVRWYYRVREPRFERLLMFLVYLLTLVMGASAIHMPPNSIEGSVGTTLAYTWASLLVVCGGFGAYGVLPGLWWAERVAVKAGGTGAAIYAAVLVHLHGDVSNNLIPTFCAVSIAALVFVGRAYKIRGVNYEPRPEKE